MRIVLDSNIFFNQYWLETTAFSVFLQGARSAGYNVFVPRIVVDEVCNLYADSVTLAYSEAVKHLENVGRLLRVRLSVEPDPRVQIRLDLYREHFPSVLSTHGIMVLDYPSISHADLAQRAIAKKKPFKKDGSGYRDALIWATVVELARDGDQSEIVLISNNIQDFASPNNGSDSAPLHPDLEHELAGSAQVVSKVTLYTSLQKFNIAVIQPALQELEGLAEQIKEGSFGNFELGFFITTAFTQYIGQLSPEDNKFGFPSFFREVTISSIDTINSIDKVNVRRLTEGNILITFEAAVTTTIAFAISKQTYERLSDESQGELDFEPGTGTQDELQNKASIECTMAGSLIFDTIHSMVSSAELLKVENVNATAWRSVWADSYGLTLYDSIMKAGELYNKILTDISSAMAANKKTNESIVRAIEATNAQRIFSDFDAMRVAFDNLLEPLRPLTDALSEIKAINWNGPVARYMMQLGPDDRRRFLDVIMGSEVDGTPEHRNESI